MLIKFSFLLHHSSTILLLFSIIFFFSPSSQGSCSDFESEPSMATLGGLRESHGAANDAEIESLARFAVDEHNKKENALLEFARVVKAKEQVVAGTLHHFTIEAIDAGKKKLYDAKVWVKPWMNFKELQEFKHTEDSPSFTSSDLGAIREGHASGWKEVPVHDPEVQNAAEHAVKNIQQRSNSLFPYELQEIAHAKAEIEEDTAKFNLQLKVKRGNKDESFNVEVHKSSDGNYNLNKMANIQPEIENQ
ncbi:cysteine proteinase inhibitor 6 isoform X2 [Amaranthus tricolor]|uniref:cysteine proteinase inhibitor 6 isoform X2 n=1 Tax=Amaranthus tricolor TaxID=29722 RepID=UPI0025903BF1|nr:cysteine proteinase inhibitor 6 isoform X2 [Amaranthus tricolor]